tara:strand:- start:10671 stop:16463 length:5793 start_codon:yes stop_codon:yes gene_type:complete
MARTRITEYKFSPGISYTSSVYPNAQALFEANINFMKTEVSAFVAAKTAEGLGSWNNYTYDADKCARDVGYVIDAYKKDLKYGGNEETTAVVTKYWDGDTPQVDGDRQPEIDTHTFLKGLISGNIFTQTAQSNPYQSAIPQVTTGSAPESGAATRTDTLADITINVITSGLTAMPAKVANGYSRIKVPQRVLEEDILLITNASKGEVIYNFNDVNKLAVCSLTTFERDKRLYQQTDYEHDEDFYNFLQNGEYVTDIALYYDTATHSSTDNVQIFIDKGEQQVRPFDFGTDAIERNRVANPLSMLDADFEYGLQPTKWQAIGMLRGYPSIYEVPGTDVTVSAITSDVSAGTSGIGQSKITVTTLGNHGFSIGTPVTVKGLEPSIDGSSRAEGSFIITAVPSDTTFEYYAKSKVGTNNPANLYTPYVQLRKGGFYTGANISESPTFTVVSNGSQGTFTLPIAVNTGSSRLPFYGSVPELGAPLDDVGSAFIPLGAQVTGVVGTGGNPEITLTVVNDAPAGSTTIDVSSTSGVLQNMAVDDDSDANFIQNIAGAQITLESGIGAQLTGDNQTYTQVEGTNVSPTGNGASFDVTNTNGTYACTGNQTGTGYAIGDYIIIDGGSLGGQSGVHDLEIRVTDSNTPGEVLNFAFSGTGFNGVATYNNLGGTTLGGLGTGAEFNVTKTSGTYTAEVFSPNASTDYRVNDRIKITGGFLGGADSTNDCIITVTDVDSFGNILTVTASGTATDANVNYPGVDFTTTGSGTGAGFSVSKVATVYSATVDAAGQNFQVNDTITILGTALGGTSPTNDLTLTVDAVDVNGAITTVSESGTGLNSQVYAQITQANQTNLVGSGAAFNISTASGSYTAVVATAGEGYGINDEILIPGTDLGGSSPANDCTLTVIAPLDSIDGVTDVNESGNAVPGSGSFTDVQGNNEEPNGNGASFDITRSAQVYTVAVNTPGSQYKIGNRILISGNDLGGNSPANDLIITADTVGTPNGDITATTEEGSGAPGSTLTVYSTVSMSESTTNPLQALSTVNFDALATISVSFGSPHGLVPGSTFIVSVDSDDGSNNHYLAAGSFIATSVSALDQISYQALSVGTINTGNNNDDAIQGTVYPRPDSFFVHRPFDGGVQLGTGSPVHGAQAIRQSKKYIRYQSGKGIMYTTGALFAPSYDLLSVTADGTAYESNITVTTDDVDHGLQVGAGIRLVGIATPGYNGNYTVDSIVDERSFKVKSQYYLGATTATLTDNPQVQTRTWHGSVVRAGTYDEQNGIFFEYNGKYLYCVLRSATFQLSGTCSAQKDANEITGLSTRFQDQLSVGDRIVIRGMTHVVTKVNSQTSINVAPDFRGVTSISGAKMAKVKDTKARQDQWNRDKCDGTGKSGYNLDISYMQMIGIQYSWYGAGFIDYMFRGGDGNFIMAHRIRNSNVNTEAYMRTGNQPVRYEVMNESAIGKLKSTITAEQTTIELIDASDFPDDGGTIYIDNELITYTGITSNTLTGCTRAAPLQQYASGSLRTYTAASATTHTEKTGLVLVSNTTTPIIQHWGSSFITDGGFDSDRGFLFSYAATGVEFSTTPFTSFLIRLAPSVSNALTGDLGERELINRAQLLLEGLEITTEPNASGQTGNIVVSGVINPQNYPVNPNDIGWQGLTGVAQGGQPSFAQIAPGGSVNWNSGATTVTQTATTQGAIDGQITQSQFNSRRQIRILVSEINTRFGTTDGQYIVGLPVVGNGKLQSGTIITRLSGTYGSGANQYFRYDLSLQATSNITVGETVSIRKEFNDAPTSNLYFQKASWESSGATQGTSVAASDTRFPANTSVVSVQLETFAGTEYYDVQFSQSSDNSTITKGTTTVTFDFTQPPYAQPGETIFGFVARPGERSTLDLSFIKELTNTTLGGRGTFPNGPDVLALNVYKTSGQAVNGEIILRWSEAQA